MSAAEDDYAAERDQQARADAVYARIEELDSQLLRVLTISDFLRVLLQSKEAETVWLKERIQALHIKRHAIFHEGDQ